MMQMKWLSYDMISAFLRQIVNVWLAYTLSQPIDVDVPVVMNFIRLYLGIPLLECLVQKIKYQIVISLPNKTSKETIEELIPQKSYS
jgi:hypothetical protein